MSLYRRIRRRWLWAIDQQQSVSLFLFAWMLALVTALAIILPLVWCVAYVFVRWPWWAGAALLVWIIINAARYAHQTFPDPDESQREG